MDTWSSEERTVVSGTEFNADFYSGLRLVPRTPKQPYQPEKKNHAGGYKKQQGEQSFHVGTCIVMDKRKNR
jgi:hypothetical protein